MFKGLKSLLIIAALLLVSVDGWAQSCDGCGIGYRPSTLSSSGGTLTGPLLLPNGSAAAPSLAFASNSDTGIFWNAPNGRFDFSYDGTARNMLSAARFIVGYGYADASVYFGGDTLLIRDAANTLALRNGTNAQQFNLYETYTDASNYSRLGIQATAGAFKLLPAAAGTGTLRVVAIGDGGAKPTCEAATRGGIWYDAGGAGAADTLEVCRKDAGDAYAWVSLF